MTAVIHDDYRFQVLINQIEAYQRDNDQGNLRASLAVLQHMAEKQQDPIGLAATYFYQGMLLTKDNDQEEGIVYIKKAWAISNSHNIAYYLMKCENILGAICVEDADFYSGLKHYLKAYHIAQEHPDYLYDGIVLNNIGNLFVWLDEYEPAAYYLEQAYTMYISYGNENRAFLAELVINIIEMYSGMGEYQQAEQWHHIENLTFTEEESLTLECIFLINEARALYMQGDEPHTKSKIREFSNRADASESYIYIFRCFLRAFDLSISLNDFGLAAELKEEIERLSEKELLSNFQYNYADLNVKYMKQFKESHHLNECEYLEFYYQQGKKRIRELSNTYTRSLFAEIELDRSKLEQSSVMKENEKLQQDIERDTFTNLYNKVSTEKYVREALCNGGSDAYLVMMLIDIDKFKNVNDYYGHDFGDRIIVQSAEILKEIPIEDKITGRFGGDEFLIFLTDVKQVAVVHTTANRLLNHVRKLDTPDNRMQQITFSMGICFARTGDSFDQVFKKADQALYQAKEQGRDRYIIYMDV